MNSKIEIITEKFFDAYLKRKYSKGQILIFSGDRTKYVYYLVSGRVKQYDVTYRGEEVILNVFKPRAFFPMSLAINSEESLYIFEAETDIEVRQAPIADVMLFLNTHPDVVFDLLRRVYKGVDGLLGRMARLMASSAKARLMYEIVIACRRFGELSKDGSCTVSLNESDLATRAGLTRETVSREMRKLKRNNLVDVQPGKVIVLDLKTLEAKLEQTT